MLIKKKRGALMRRHMKQEQRMASQFVNVPISSPKIHEKIGMKVLRFTRDSIHSNVIFKFTAGEKERGKERFTTTHYSEGAEDGFAHDDWFLTNTESSDNKVGDGDYKIDDESEKRDTLY